MRGNVCFFLVFFYIPILFLRVCARDGEQLLFGECVCVCFLYSYVRCAAAAVYHRAARKVALAMMGTRKTNRTAAATIHTAYVRRKV